MSGGSGYALSDEDIAHAADTHVIEYSDLFNAPSLASVFDPKGRVVMLYETTGPLSGHWVCMIRRGGSVEYFDPYGGIRPDGELKWLTPAKAAQLGENQKTLSKLIAASGLSLTVNPFHYQAQTPGNNECGRHCVARVHFSFLTEPEYHRMVTSECRSAGYSSPDQWALMVSNQLMGH